MALVSVEALHSLTTNWMDRGDKAGLQNVDLMFQIQVADSARRLNRLFLYFLPI
jgi:hypothetical protein